MPPHTHPKTLQNLIITFLFFLAGKQLSSQWIQVSRVICNMPKSILCSVSPDGPRAAWCNKRTEGVHWLNCWAVEKKKKKKEAATRSNNSRSAVSQHKSYDATIWRILRENSSQKNPGECFSATRCNRNKNISNTFIFAHDPSVRVRRNPFTVSVAILLMHLRTVWKEFINRLSEVFFFPLASNRFSAFHQL